MPAYTITLTTTEVLDVERTDQAAEAFLRRFPGLDPDMMHVTRNPHNPAHDAEIHVRGSWGSVTVEEDAEAETGPPIDIAGALRLAPDEDAENESEEGLEPHLDDLYHSWPR